ncbi:hypothetical protein CANTEDRAFT_113635 [Yamadazyma tenuis ATCC 10573]|uniref:O-acyltransferase n=2 Tax=Candida tenuis TaxID=2315449 RepID=G3B141_CANTC|nr:MBOAT-domain-containing protein [Yamadazyma tenuis ATCC 10573]XP_006685967.1 uncharacterized protein CANTEDRAFT_113635 [Yamadazyma tenuis ATCC 10573]EGV65160.1 MBOAT-domain-containing protein [Yamadazyma tenuis ATCC 10573]EGV65161.1 hypothetical protein CANTEDRAFT_113635 [Yamadazyma tenuis ATCC 10573]
MQHRETDQNLSIIVGRNSGTRASLVGSDEYKEFSTEIEGTGTSEIDQSFPQSEIQDVPVEVIRTKINSIDAKHRHTRVKKPKRGESTSESTADGPNYRSQFGDIKFLETSTTIFDADYFKDSEMYGIYVLFWLATGFLMVNNIVHAWIDQSAPFYQLPVVQVLRKDLWKVALVDCLMYLSTYFAYFVQKLCKLKVLNWQRTGWFIQGTYDFFFLLFWSLVASEHILGFPWIGRVFLMLHSLVFLMKMHSYGFYNGYLWTISEELEFSEKYISRCTPDNHSVSPEKDLDEHKQTLLNSIKFCKFELAFQASANYTSNDPNVILDGPSVKFPDNITVENFFWFSMFPTVVYTLNFPRTKRIRWSYVGEKVLAVFGIFFLMIIIAQKGFYPLILQARAAKTLPSGLKVQQYFLVLIDMIPYFLLEYIFTFFIIWEFILNVIAELSCFADRDFYGPWWSCSDWGEFARIWNRPVHKFLLRHVYHSSISTIRLNSFQASIFTFVLSSLVHELVMFCIFRTFRGYLLLLQMSQLPMMMIAKTPLMKGRKTLGIVVCWVGFISGPSIICTLYLFF